MKFGRKIRLIISTILCILVFSGVSFVHASTDSVSVYIRGKFDYGKAYEVLQETNKVRKKQGLSALEMDADLMEAAMQRAAEISLIFSHERPDGSECFTVSSKAHSENIAAGQSSAASVVNAWKNSRGHYKNMMDETCESIGVGCFYQNNVVCWVQLFGTSSAKSTSKPSNATKTVRVNVSRYLMDECSFIASSSSKSSDGHRLDKGASSILTLQFLSMMDHYPTFAIGNVVPQISWKNFRLTSSNPSIVSVNSSGKITAKKRGTAVIYAQSLSTPGFCLKYKVNVKDKTDRTLVLNANGGSFGKTSSLKTKALTVTNKKRYGNLPAVYRKGYIFKGWYTKKSGGTRIKSNSSVKISKGKTQTLYARWSKVTVKQASVSSVSFAKSKRRLTVSWKKISGVSGYELSVSSSRKFEKAVSKTVRMTGNSVKKYSFANLKTAQKYYVRIRAFKKDSCGNRIYGKYSPVKTA
ncbi:MAG: CAP domain-containing protein [Eubacteriales bacterium]|nr:CAP domain-containing protein [Eubacteriales bacterium]